MKRLITVVMSLLLAALPLMAVGAEEHVALLAIDPAVVWTDAARLGAAQTAAAAAFPGLQCLTGHADAGDMQQYREGKVPEKADMLHLRSADLSQLVERGEILDLSGDGALADLLEKLPDYGLLTGRDGAVYALPCLLRVQLARAGDPDALEAAGLAGQNALLWEQVFEAAPKLAAYNSKNGKSLKLLYDQAPFPAFLSQFYWDEVRKPTDAALRAQRLKALVQGYRELESMGMLAQDRQEDAVLSLTYADPRALDAGRCLLPPACAPEGLRSALSAEFLVVRAASDRRAAALALLEGLFSKEAVSASAEYGQSGVYPKGDERAYLKTEAASDLWTRGIAAGYPQAPDGRLLEIFAHWDAYRKGTVGLEECIQAMLKQLP